MTGNKRTGAKNGPKIYDAAFGAQYEALRAKGLTQAQIAEELGCTAATLRRLFGAKKSGRPALQREERIASEVREMAGMGLCLHDIGRVLSISDNVIKKLYQDDMEIGVADANRKVANSLFRAATADKPNVTACIFWLKARAGWRDAVPEPDESASLPSKAALDALDSIYSAAAKEAAKRRDQLRTDRADLYGDDEISSIQSDG